MAFIDMHKTGVRAMLRSAVTGLRTTERTGGYVLLEDGEIAPGRAAARLIGVSLLLAGLGLLGLTVAAGAVGKAIVAVALIAAGGVLAARAGRVPRHELEVDLDKAVLRRRALTAAGGTRLLAQWSFAEVSGLDVSGEAGRAALVLQTGTRQAQVLQGAPEALRAAARRIGADLLRARGIG